MRCSAVFMSPFLTTSPKVGVSRDEYFEGLPVIFRQCPRFESFEKSFQFPLDFFCHGRALHEYTITAAKAALS